MLRFLLKRGLQGLVSLFLLQTAVFTFMHLLMAGDFVSLFAMGLTTEEELAMRTELGLNLPLWQQYLNWLKGLLELDLGTSFFGHPVIDGVLSSLPETVLVFVVGLAIAYLLGSWLGRVTAWRGPGVLSDLTTLTAITFYAFFPPALAFILRTILGERLGWFPHDLTLFMYNYNKQFSLPIDEVITRMVQVLPAAIAAVLVLNLLLRRLVRLRIPTVLNLVLLLVVWGAGWQSIQIGAMAVRALHLAGIPILAFVFLSTGEMMVIARTSMAEVIDEQYVQTAKAKGLRSAQIRDRHVARNALLPLLSRLVISLPYLLGGLAIIESSVGWPGMGASIFAAAQVQDVPMVLGFLLVIGGLVLASRLILEVLYTALDPRIRVASRRSG